MRSIVLASVCALAVSGCGGESGDEVPQASPPPTMSASAPVRSVTIETPADGDTVQGPSVDVRISAQGFAVVAAGDTTSNSGHLHIFLDRDLSAPGQAIPVEPGFIIHLGTGASEYTIPNVSAGTHTLVAVVGDAVHVPLQPWVVDTVRFTVR